MVTFVIESLVFALRHKWKSRGNAICTHDARQRTRLILTATSLLRVVQPVDSRITVAFSLCLKLLRHRQRARRRINMRGVGPHHMVCSTEHVRARVSNVQDKCTAGLFGRLICGIPFLFFLCNCVRLSVSICTLSVMSFCEYMRLARCSLYFSWFCSAPFRVVLTNVLSDRVVEWIPGRAVMRTSKRRTRHASLRDSATCSPCAKCCSTAAGRKAETEGAACAQCVKARRRSALHQGSRIWIGIEHQINMQLTPKRRRNGPSSSRSRLICSETSVSHIKHQEVVAQESVPNVPVVTIET